MSTNFPGSVDDGTTLPNPGASAPTNNPSLSGGQTNQNDAIKAIEAKVGTGASTPSAGKIFRGTGSGASAWGAADLTTDITGVLPIANGGTGLTVLTIPASAILVGTTDAQDVTNKTLHDTFMGNVFAATTATVRNVVLDASKDFLAFDLLEIGAAFNLEIPATSTLEVTAYSNKLLISSGAALIADTAGATLLATVARVTGAADYVTLANAASAANPVVGFSATGSDSNIHLQAIGKGNGLTKISVLRQDDTANSYKHNSVILTGWGVGNPGATNVMTETVTFGITFAALPIVLNTYGGDNTSASTTYGGGIVADAGDVTEWAHSITTGSFVSRLQRVGNWNGTTTTFYQWIAIGEF